MLWVKIPHEEELECCGLKFLIIRVLWVKIPHMEALVAL